MMDAQYAAQNAAAVKGPSGAMDQMMQRLLMLNSSAANADSRLRTTLARVQGAPQQESMLNSGLTQPPQPPANINTIASQMDMLADTMNRLHDVITGIDSTL